VLRGGITLIAVSTTSGPAAGTLSPTATGRRCWPTSTCASSRARRWPSSVPADEQEHFVPVAARTVRPTTGLVGFDDVPLQELALDGLRGQW
jgi:hypothetical protein